MMKRSEDNQRHEFLKKKKNVPARENGFAK
jgi:hypothetical protein